MRRSATGTVVTLCCLVALVAATLLHAVPARADATPNEAAAATATGLKIPYGTSPQQYVVAWIPPAPTTRMGIAVVHGGYWVAGSPEDTTKVNRKLFALGIPSFSIGYRLGAPWPVPRRDVASALAAIRANAADYGVTPSRVGLIGSSAGGHLALGVASSTGRKAACAVVSLSAPTSIDLLRSQAAGDERREILAKASTRLAPTPKLARAATLPSSPSRSDSPTMLLHGQQEWVPYVHASRYVKAYAGTGLEVRPVILSAETGHGLAYATDALAWRLLTGFFTKYC